MADSINPSMSPAARAAMQLAVGSGLATEDGDGSVMALLEPAIVSHDQTMLDTHRVRGSIYRHTARATRHIILTSIRVNDEQVRPSTRSTVKVGERLVGQFVVGQSKFFALVAVPVPKDWVSCYAISDSPYGDEVLAGAAFVIESGELVIPQEFLNKCMTSLGEYEIFCHRVEQDDGMITRQFGPPVGWQPDVPAEAAKQVLNAAWDSLLAGPTKSSITRIVAGLIGYPVFTYSGKVVAVDQFSRGTYVWTDKEVILVPAGLAVDFSAGDEVYENSSVSSDLSVGDLSVPAAVAIPGEFGTVVFPNVNYPVETVVVP